MKSLFNELHFKDLRIIEFSETHLTEQYVQWLNDPTVVLYSEQRHVNHTISSCRNYYESKKRSSDLFLAIEIRRDNKWLHIGNIGVMNDFPNRLSDMSILIGNKSYWGNGYGFKSWMLTAHGIFDNYQIDLLTAGTMQINTSMINILKLSNMTIDAVLPSRFLCKGDSVSKVIASVSKSSLPPLNILY